MTSQPIPADQVEPEQGFDPVAYFEDLPDGYNVGEHAIRIDALVPAKRNPRRGAVAEVIDSLREFGQHRPVVVRRDTREVIVGNHVLKAAQQIGWTHVDAFIVQDDEDVALRRAIADNAVGDKAAWDEDELAEILQETGPVPGFEASEIDKLLKRLAPPPDKPDPTYPLSPKLNEHYDYVFIFAENETDWTWLQTIMQLRSEQSYKSKAVAKSHVITVSRFQELWESR
jgi:hypothetical protein